MSRLYHQAILDAASARTGEGALHAPHGRASVDNPLCGDRVRVDVSVSGGRIEHVAHRVRGCLLCEAAASVIGAQAPGESVEELIALRQALRAFLSDDSLGPPRRWPALEMFAPVAQHRSRHDCVMLPFDALVKALEECERNR
ncbi:MAG TPA: iron-sulfur cluster assembly scaffold protein [Gammaproteobacteria bacterium]|nr:iron-sulfur cluster assembly scaffold protein [Gammaproteobacteria bacterium]